jgi:hypothetical protein
VITPLPLDPPDRTDAGRRGLDADEDVLAALVVALVAAPVLEWPAVPPQPDTAPSARVTMTAPRFKLTP